MKAGIRALLGAALLGAGAAVVRGGLLPVEPPTGTEAVSEWLLRKGMADEAQVTGLLVTYGWWRDVSETPVPPGAERPARLQMESDLRPAARLGRGAWELMAQPRVALCWKDPQPDAALPDPGYERDAEVYVQEWHAQVEAAPGAYLSYGRHNLQWGPGYLASPSNPFWSRTGRENPYVEQPGMDYARLSWSPWDAWTISALANTDDGLRRNVAGFEDRYALKVDRLADRRYLGLVASDGPDADWRLGAVWGWNVVEPCLVYAEGGVAPGDPEVLLGASWTWPAGVTVTGEYFFNGGGGADDDLAAVRPADGREDAREALLRRHYALLQLARDDREIGLDLLLRCTLGLSDGSGSLVGMAAQDLGRYARLFAVGTWNVGPADGEFRAQTDRWVMAGIECLF